MTTTPFSFHVFFWFFLIFYLFNFLILSHSHRLLLLVVIIYHLVIIHLILSALTNHILPFCFFPSSYGLVVTDLRIPSASRRRKKLNKSQRRFYHSNQWVNPFGWRSTLEMNWYISLMIFRENFVSSFKGCLWSYRTLNEHLS